VTPTETIDHEYAFEIAGSAVRFGAGVTREVGSDLADLGATKVLVMSDPTVSRLPPVQAVLESLESSGIAFALFDRVRVEPTDESFLDAIAFAHRDTYDAFVAVGGGSTIDTAKAANLYTTYPPADFLDYVNPPIGRGLPVPGALRPLIAIPTTAGTGSETTGVSIFDLTRLHAKTGIASRRLKPTLGLLDPENTKTMPSEVAASSGLDILSHAVESFTALPFTERPRPNGPSLRPAYQGSNPISDVWSLQALRRDLDFWLDLLYREFFAPRAIVHAAQLDAFLDHFERLGVIERSDEQLRATEKGRGYLAFLAEQTRSLLEAYYGVLSALLALEEPVPERTLEKETEAQFRRLHRVGEISRTEGWNSVTFKNALELLARRGVLQQRAHDARESAWGRGPAFDELPALRERLARALLAR